jgi:hypothetical protein
VFGSFERDFRSEYLVTKLVANQVAVVIVGNVNHHILVAWINRMPTICNGGLGVVEKPR